MRYSLKPIVRVFVPVLLFGSVMLGFQQRSNALDLRAIIDEKGRELLCRLFNSRTKQCLPKQDSTLPPEIDPTITDPPAPQLPTPENPPTTPPELQLPSTPVRSFLDSYAARRYRQQTHGVRVP